jgi:hypothetical protein
LLVDLADLRLRQRRAVRCVLQGLPDDVPARIVELVLDDDERPLLVDRQQVQPFARFIESIEFLLDDEKLARKTRAR